MSSLVIPAKDLPNSTSPAGTTAAVVATPVNLLSPVCLKPSTCNSLSPLCIVLNPVLIISAGKDPDRDWETNRT